MVSRYFLKLEQHLTKPESRCVREMTTGILKSGTILVNKKLQISVTLFH